MTTKLITRKEWGARKPKKRNSFLRREDVVCIAVHHTASGKAQVVKSEEQEKADLRAVQNFHMDRRGWNDIAYNYMIFPSGRVYELRGPGRSGANGNQPLNVAHAAVCLYGDHSNAEPTVSAERALRHLVAELRSQYPKIDRVLGHRDLKATACPGDGLIGLVRELDRDKCCDPEPTPGEVTFDDVVQTFETAVVSTSSQGQTPGGAEYRTWVLADGRRVTVWDK